MRNQPRTITLISKNTQKRRIIHLITRTKKKTFKSASAKCNAWVLNNSFPLTLKVCYGDQDNKEESATDRIYKYIVKDMEKK